MTTESELEDTLARYAKYLNESGLSEVTIKNYIGDIGRYASWLARARTKPLLEATAEDIHDYCLELLTARAHLVATVNRCLQAIRKFYRYALRLDLVEEDPSLGIKLLPQPRTRAARVLDQSEIDSLLSAVGQGSAGLVKRDYAIVQLMLQTGIRVGELTKLQLADVSLLEGKGVLRIRGQGGFRDREIPLNNSARKAIRAYLEERSAGASDHLFLTRNGAPLSLRSVQRLVNAYARAAGLENVSAYTLRHTYGQHMLRDTGDPSLVARLMGHKRLETVVKYILPRQEDLTEIAERSSLNVY